MTLVLEASSKASSHAHIQAKATAFAAKAFTEKVTECTKELHLDLMISEEEPNIDGTMLCYHNLLEIERVAEVQSNAAALYLRQISFLR